MCSSLLNMECKNYKDIRYFLNPLAAIMISNGTMLHERDNEHLIWASTQENLRGVANNKGTDHGQPAHPRGLISALVIHFWKV